MVVVSYEQELRKSDCTFIACCRIHAPGEIAGTSGEHPLGLLPHQIRGSLSQYSLLTLLGYSSSNCTACSNAVCELLLLCKAVLICKLPISYVIHANKYLQVLYEYGRRGMDFLVQAINEPTYLEDLTGLTDLMKSASHCQVEWVDESDEDEFVEI
jgi:ubiquitin-like modifier-activating enzyme ATG7